MISEEKYQESIEILKLAGKMSDQYYGEPLLIAYSGGKDSDVLLQLARESGIRFEVKNSHTTVDAPETVYHIREVFAELEKQGIHAEVHHARYKDGKLKTMWNLIQKKNYPPTRVARYCCQELKETTTPNRFIALGVRREESAKRAHREAFEVRGANKNGIRKTLSEAKEVYNDAQVYDEVYDCKFIELAKKHADLMCCPIYAWSEEDVWDFIKSRSIKTNPLYEKGFDRVGCIGCPMATRREREREFLLYPQYETNYKKAFGKINTARYFGKADARNYMGNQKKIVTAQDVFDWWMEDPRLYGQMTFDEMEAEDE